MYAAIAYVDGRGPGRPTATHIGPNATFGEQERKVEDRREQAEIDERMQYRRPMGDSRR